MSLITIIIISQSVSQAAFATKKFLARLDFLRELPVCLFNRRHSLRTSAPEYPCKNNLADLSCALNLLNLLLVVIPVVLEASKSSTDIESSGSNSHPN